MVELCRPYRACIVGDSLLRRVLPYAVLCRPIGACRVWESLYIAYFVNSTLQNENFCRKMGNFIGKLHFLVKLFGHSEKKSYLCMLFRGEASLARVYTGTRSLFRAGRRAGGRHGNI